MAKQSMLICIIKPLGLLTSQQPTWLRFGAQIREQMSGPEISQYGILILGCGLWPGLVSGKKGSGPIMSNFFFK